MRTTIQHNNISTKKKTTFFNPNAIQPKLTIGQPNDKYEQEADVMADKVMRMPQNTPAIQTQCAGCEQEENVQPKRKGNFLSLKRLIQKMSSPEEELQTKPMLQRMGNTEEETLQTKPLMMKSEGGGGVATSALTSQLNSSKGGGSPLPASTNQFMSNAFGSDFSGVRVHTGSKAIQMNQGLGARAFAHGSDVYFNRGEYRPSSSDGKKLLGHELTHVVQQEGAQSKTIQRDSGLFGGKGCNESANTEYALLANGTWSALTTGQCTGSFTDCEGMTCGGGFYYISDFQTGTCRTPREDDATFRSRRWTPSETGRSDAQSPTQRGASSNTPPNYVYDGSSATTASSTAARCTPDRVAGATTSGNIIRISWTFDDGPHLTHSDQAATAAGGLRGTTWFVVKRALDVQGQPAIDRLRRIQNQEGGEIALHFEKSWFPGQTGAFPNIGTAMDFVREFKSFLNSRNITTNFVRPHGGLISELADYFVHLGIPGRASGGVANQIARHLIRPNSRNSRAPQSQAEITAYQTVQQDFNTMKSRLQGMQLHLWSGNSSGAEISSQSWEAEVGIRDNLASKFRNMVSQSRFPRSLIVLAHDTSPGYVASVRTATQEIEQLATDNDIKIEYYTLSNLYHCLRGDTPERIRPQ